MKSTQKESADVAHELATRFSLIASQWMDISVKLEQGKWYQVAQNLDNTNRLLDEVSELDDELTRLLMEA